jgi:hypothetical protein
MKTTIFSVVQLSLPPIILNSYVDTLWIFETTVPLQQITLEEITIVGLTEYVSYMEDSLSWEADSLSSGQEMPRVLCNRKGSLWCALNSFPWPILSQLKPFCTLAPGFLNIQSGSVVVWGTMLQAGRSLDFFIYWILPAAPWHWGRLSL